jgi:hypothetical protein
MMIYSVEYLSFCLVDTNTIDFTARGALQPTAPNVRDFVSHLKWAVGRFQRNK